MIMIMTIIILMIMMRIMLTMLMIIRRGAGRVAPGAKATAAADAAVLRRNAIVYSM